MTVSRFLGFEGSASLLEASDAGEGVVARNIGLSPAPPDQFELSVDLREASASSFDVPAEGCVGSEGLVFRRKWCVLKRVLGRKGRD